MKMVRLSLPEAEGFYAVHRQRPFFASLTRFMTEDRVVVMVLEAEDAIPRLREVMGATDPAKAAEGTIRKLYGSSIEQNAIHGSDAPDTARFEISYFFNALGNLRGRAARPVAQRDKRTGGDARSSDEESADYTDFAEKRKGRPQDLCHQRRGDGSTSGVGARLS